MNKNYAVIAEFMEEESGSVIQYVADDDGDAYRINQNLHSFVYVDEWRFMNYFESDMKAAYSLELEEQTEAFIRKDLAENSPELLPTLERLLENGKPEYANFCGNVWGVVRV